MLTSSEALGFEQIEVQGSSNLGDLRSIVGEVGYLKELLVLEVDSAISLADLDRDVLDVRLIIYILDCIAETDGWGEVSFIFTSRKFIDLLNSLFTPYGGGAVTSFGLPSSRHSTLFSQCLYSHPGIPRKVYVSHRTQSQHCRCSESK